MLREFDGDNADNEIHFGNKKSKLLKRTSIVGQFRLINLSITFEGVEVSIDCNFADRTFCIPGNRHPRSELFRRCEASHD